MRYCLILFLAFIFIQPANAAEPVPGDSCPAAGATMASAEGSGGHFMICEGGTWKPVYSYNASGTLTMMGNQHCTDGQILKFNDGIWACGADENDSGLDAPPVCTGANAALQWNGSSWGCITIAGGGGGGPPIVNGNHTQQQCVDAGGIINLSDFGGDILCTFSGMTCPSGWTSYGKWYRTAKTCTGSGNAYFNCTGTSCTLAGGWLTSTAARSCTYKTTSGSTCPNTSCAQAAGVGVTTAACY